MARETEAPRDMWYPPLPRRGVYSSAVDKGSSSSSFCFDGLVESTCLKLYSNGKRHKENEVPNRLHKHSSKLVFDPSEPFLVRW